VTDVDFGISSYATCAILTGAGFSFSWHEDQPPDRRDDIWTTHHPGWRSSSTSAGNRRRMIVRTFGDRFRIDAPMDVKGAGTDRWTVRQRTWAAKMFAQARMRCSATLPAATNGSAAT